MQKKTAARECLPEIVMRCYAPGEFITVGKKNIVLQAVWKPKVTNKVERETSEYYEVGTFVDG